MKNIFLLLISVLLPIHSYGGRYIQDEDVKTLTDLTNAGSTAAHLINATKIYDTVNSQQLSVTLAALATPFAVSKTTIATQAISASAIDWSTGSAFTKTLGANTTFTFSNQISGQTIVVRLTNTASNWTVTWPTVKWSGGTTPTQTVGAKSDVYTFFYDGTDIYGNVVQNF